MATRPKHASERDDVQPTLNASETAGQTRRTTAGPRDGGDASEAATQTPQQEAVRDLHAPDALSGSLRCLGCDFDGWEAEARDWPCRTARLVYSDDEIADILATYASWSAWVGAAQRRAYLASGWTFADDLAAGLRRVDRVLVALEVTRRPPEPSACSTTRASGERG